MKFQKGLLNDLVPKVPRREEQNPGTNGVESKAKEPLARAGSGLSEKDHLFETLQEETSHEKNYLKLLGVVVISVIAIGLIAVYLMMPGIGDAVRAPTGLELALRDHFLTIQKRTATDIIVYKCAGYYAARVGVETRNDLPNPVFRIGTYSAKAVETEGRWDVTAAPLTPPDEFVPCRTLNPDR
jgi:hypothetical protein